MYTYFVVRLAQRLVQRPYFTGVSRFESLLDLIRFVAHTVQLSLVF